MANPLLTPTTTLLNSILDGQTYLSLPYLPSPPSRVPQGEDVDVFAQAFSAKEPLLPSQDRFRNTGASDGSSSSMYLEPKNISSNTQRNETQSLSIESESQYGEWGKSFLVNGGPSEKFPPITEINTSLGSEWPMADNSGRGGLLSKLSAGAFGFWTPNQKFESPQAHASELQSLFPPLVREDDAIHSHDLQPKHRRTRRKKRPPTIDEAKHKRETFLERNRRAAHRCRTKKRVQTNDLVTQLEELQEARKKLEVEYSDVLEEVTALREEAQRKGSAVILESLELGHLEGLMKDSRLGAAHERISEADAVGDGEYF